MGRSSPFRPAASLASRDDDVRDSRRDICIDARGDSKTGDTHRDCRTNSKFAGSSPNNTDRNIGRGSHSLTRNNLRSHMTADSSSRRHRSRSRTPALSMSAPLQIPKPQHRTSARINVSYRDRRLPRSRYSHFRSGTGHLCSSTATPRESIRPDALNHLLRDYGESELQGQTTYI